IMPDVLGEYRSLQCRSQKIRQQQVRNSPQLVAGSRMAGNIDIQAAQLLNESPNFRASRTDFLRDLRTADDDGRVVHQQPDNSPQPDVSLCGCLFLSLWRGLSNVGIMRQEVRKHKPSALMSGPLDAKAAPRGEAHLNLSSRHGLIFESSA